jgi:HlyD family secretion protein
MKNTRVLKKNCIIEKNIRIYYIKLNTIIARSRLPKPFKNNFILGEIFLLVIFVIVLLSSFSGENDSIPVYNVKRGDFLITITESGEIRAKNSLSIMAPRIRGNLKIVYLIPEGTKVKPGDIVCKFDPSEVIVSLKEAEAKLEIALSDREKLIANHKAAVAQSESQLKSAELSFELSKLKLEQVKFEALTIQQQTKLEHEKSRLSYEQTKQEAESKKIINISEMDKMKVEIKQRHTDLEKVQKDLEQLTLVAPTEGLVVYAINWSNNGRKFSIGDSPWGGAQIITLPDLSEMESITNINEVDVSKLKAGQKSLVNLDAFQDSSFSGVINNIASIGKNKEQGSNIKVFEVLIDINERSDILRPGMTSSNRIIINALPKVLFIPHEAVFEKEGKKIAYVKNGSSFDEKQIELGEKGEDYIVVKKGLDEGDKVALLDPTVDPEKIANVNKDEKVSMPGGR